MSKNFEEEYKALADQELPDLWDRIEEGLAPRSTPKEPVKKSTKIVQFVRRYKGSLAAVVCVLLILPAAILISRNTKKSDAADHIANERFRRPVVLTEELERMPEEAAAAAGEEASYPEDAAEEDFDLEGAAMGAAAAAGEEASYPEDAAEEDFDLEGATQDTAETGIALLSENPSAKQSSAEKSQAQADAEDSSSSQIIYEKVAFQVEKVSEEEPQKIEIVVLQEQEALSAGTKLWVQKLEDIKLTSGESYYGDLVFQEKEQSYMLDSIYPDRP